MKLKLDENLSCHLKPALTELGHDILTAADEDLLSHPDTEIARVAKEEQRMLMTLTDLAIADIDQFALPAFNELQIGEGFPRVAAVSGFDGATLIPPSL